MRGVLAPMVRSASMNSRSRERTRLGVDDAGGLDPVHQRDHQRDDPEARLQDGGEADGEQQRGKRHHQIGEAHQRAADPAAEIASRDSDQGSDQQSCAIRDDADDQGGPGSIEDTGGKVASEQVGAQPEFFAGRQRRSLERQTVEHLLVRIVLCQQRGKDGARHGDGDQGEADNRQAALQKLSPDPAARLDGQQLG